MILRVSSVVAILPMLIMYADALGARPARFPPDSSKRGSKTVLGFTQIKSQRRVASPGGFPGRAAACLVLGGLMLAFAGCNSVASRGMNAYGVRLFEQARYDEALAQFREASFAGPSDPDGYYNLGATYHRTGRLRNRPEDIVQAEKYYRMCFERDQNHPECHRGLAVLLAEENREEEAFALLKDWTDRQPAHPTPRIELARLTNEFGDREAAKDILVDALAIDPNNPRTLCALGSIREQMGDKTQALNDYARSLAANPNQPRVASRVAALQPTRAPIISVPTPDGRGQLVERDGNLRR